MIFSETMNSRAFELVHSTGQISGEHVRFFITTAQTDWLNGKHVVFGEVMEGELTT